MKKLIQIAVLIVVAVSTVKAQKVSQETINKAIDKLNCLATENSVIEIKKTWKCDCSSNPGFEKIKSSIPNDLSNTAALSIEINQIKNHKVPSSSKDELIKFLSEDVFAKQTQFARLYSFSSSRASNSAFRDWKRKLKSEISEIVSNTSTEEKKPDEEIVQQPPVQEPLVFDQVVNTKENEANSLDDKRDTSLSKGVFTFEIDVVAIILMIILGIVIIKLSNSSTTTSSIQSKRDIPESIRSYVKEKIESASFANRGSINSVYSSNEISPLKDEIFQLRKEIESLNQKVYAEKIPFEVIQPKYEDPNSESKRPTNETKTSSEAIYLSTPNNEGSFNDSSSSTSYREGASIYRFVKSSSNEASFQIDDRESSIKMAMQFPEKNIIPVCDSENEYEPKYSKVKTIEPGKVSLEGGKWNVKRKAKIRYES